MHRLRRLSWLAYVLVFAAVPVVFSQRRNNVTVNVYNSPTPNPTSTPTPKPKSDPKPADPTIAAQKIKLFYLREATKLAAVLNEIAKPEGSKLNGLVAKTVAEDEVILYGTRDQRQFAWRVIAALDLPRPGVEMEMWGVQISSNKPEQLEKVMPAVRQQIDRTQQAVRDAYAELQRLTIEEIPEPYTARRPNPNLPATNFRSLLVEELGYKSALDIDRPLSLTDILLRMIAAQRPGEATKDIANRMQEWWNVRRTKFLVTPTCWETPTRPPRNFKAAIESRPEIAFRQFFKVRGLTETRPWTASRQADLNALMARGLIIDFGYEYGRLVHRPQQFSPYNLQQSSEALNSRLQAATDALNADIQEMFAIPTLLRIGEIVRCYDHVDYAQVGKVNVAGLSGVPTAVKSKSVNAFEVTPPLTLSGLAEKAKKISESITPFDPAANTVGALPLAHVIGLIGAFGDEQAVWRQTNTGVSVTVTPNVLRNMTSAELKIDLQTGDPVASGTEEKNVRPLSRVSQHDVNTTVYVNALDFFDLSAFSSQATLGGGRGMVPIIGPIWRGLFGEIPVAGKLFSWQKSPKTVYSDSLILTNSFITPTAMGIALLYPTEVRKKCRNGLEESDPVEKWEAALNKCFKDQGAAVEKYKDDSQRQWARY